MAAVSADLKNVYTLLEACCGHGRPQMGRGGGGNGVTGCMPLKFKKCVWGLYWVLDVYWEFWNTFRGLSLPLLQKI